MLSRCAQTDIMPPCSPLSAKKGYPSPGKWRIPIFRHHCLNSPLILSWLYLGINRVPCKCIPYDLKKKLAEADTFLHIAQFCMKNLAKNEGGQNKWSDGCPRRRRKQKWHDGEKIFANAKMVGGKAGTSRHAGRKNPVGLYLWRGLCRGQVGTDSEKSGSGLLQSEKNRSDL